MVKNSLMLFSPSPKVCQAGYWGYTFSKSLSKLVIGCTFSQKLSKLVIGVHYTPIITRTPSSTSTPTPHTPYTNYTPTIHYPTTQPIPLLLRVDSDEMRQNRKVFAHEVLEYSQRAPYGAKSPRSGLRACAGANEGG